MKFLPLLLILILLFSCSQNKTDTVGTHQNKTDSVKTHQDILGGDHINGRAKSITEYTYHAVDRAGTPELGDYNGKRIRFYDVNGFCTGSKYYSSTNNLISYDTNRYDDEGRLLELKAYDKKGKFSQKIIPKYYDKGTPFETNYYNADGEQVFRWLLKTDENGRIAEAKGYLPNGKLFIIKSSYQYDDNGRIVGWTGSKSDGSSASNQRMEYSEYDNEGNWLKEIRFKNSIPDEITKREIQYYE